MTRPPEDEVIVTVFGQWPNPAVVAVDTVVARAAAGVRARQGFRRRMP